MRLEYWLFHLRVLIFTCKTWTSCFTLTDFNFFYWSVGIVSSHQFKLAYRRQSSDQCQKIELTKTNSKPIGLSSNCETSYNNKRPLWGVLYDALLTLAGKEAWYGPAGPDSLWTPQLCHYGHSQVPLVHQKHYSPGAETWVWQENVTRYKVWSSVLEN